MSEPVLLVEYSNGVATVTLNRPDSLNALSSQLRQQLVITFRDLQADPGVRVIILTGAGRAFCAGVDLKEIGSSEQQSLANSNKDGDVISAIAGFEGPVIGAINGLAITGGFELTLACDLIIASTDARFADTHARVGLLPEWGLSQRLSRVIGVYRAKELSLTGNYLSSAQAEQWGLVNRVVEPAALLPTCNGLANDMLSCVPDALTSYKQIIDQGFAAALGEGLMIEHQLARPANRSVTAKGIEQRRQEILARGRDQVGE
ncbi:MAG: enoyl-CoA hydratase [Acidimicrobiales bacterium]